MMKWVLIFVLVIFSAKVTLCQELQKKIEQKEKSSLFKQPVLNIPKRPKKTIGASEFVKQVSSLNLEEREKAILREVSIGNVPLFSRYQSAFKATDSLGNELLFFASSDYLAIGSNKDFVYVPTSPTTAQKIANSLDCILPTKKIVDLIYAQSEVKLSPQPIPPSEKMTTFPVFWQHTDSIKHQLTEIGFKRMVQKSLAGHKKDIICTNKIYKDNNPTGKVVIYGWHKNENSPIQPVFAGHTASYADYSHGLRLISKLAFLNGVSIDLTTILKDQNLSKLISDEGIIEKPFYPTN